MSKGFSKRVITLVEQRLASIGFKRREGIPSLYVAEDVLGVVGLNRGHSGWGPGVLDINPVVGVRNQRVERLVAEIVGEPFDEVNGFTGRNVGYLSPRKKFWPFLFQEGDVFEDTVDQLVDAVRTYGLPFITSNIPLSSILETIRRLGQPEAKVYRIPVALHLLGKCSEADAFVDEDLTKLGPRSDLAAESYRAFAPRFREWNHTDTQRSNDA
jgi:hypothetical protein